MSTLYKLEKQIRMQAEQLKRLQAKIDRHAEEVRAAYFEGWADRNNEASGTPLREADWQSSKAFEIANRQPVISRGETHE